MKHIHDCIYIGQNAKENWQLVQNSHEDYTWFHLADSPSCHVVCTQSMDLDIIKKCAQLCKTYSKHKNSKRVKVIYTICYNLVKCKTPGEVKIIDINKVNYLYV